MSSCRMKLLVRTVVQVCLFSRLEPRKFGAKRLNFSSQAGGQPTTERAASIWSRTSSNTCVGTRGTALCRLWSPPSAFSWHWLSSSSTEFTAKYQRFKFEFSRAYLYFQTSVIKASGRELSYILLLSIILCYLMTFVLLSRPSKFVCAVRRTGAVGQNFHQNDLLQNWSSIQMTLNIHKNDLLRRWPSSKSKWPFTNLAFRKPFIKVSF
jgi:hypothetical protein